MRALVVYESLYGNTHVVAGNIADGLRSDFEVTLVPVAEASWDLIADADLLVAGAPTHMHGMSSRSTRRMAAEAADKDGSGLRIEPDAGGPGMRDWLGDLGHRDGLAATFDTRQLVAAPESFLVGSQNTLLDGETARARRWGMMLGAVSKTYLPTPA